MEKNNISAKDYTHLNGVSGPVPTIDQMEQVVIENFQKGRTTEEIFLGGLNVLDKLEKGKRGTVGEIRTWSGKKYQKTVDGWVPMKEGSSTETKETSTEKSEMSEKDMKSLISNVRKEISGLYSDFDGTPDEMTVLRTLNKLKKAGLPLGKALTEMHNSSLGVSGMNEINAFLKHLYKEKK